MFLFLNPSLVIPIVRVESLIVEPSDYPKGGGTPTRWRVAVITTDGIKQEVHEAKKEVDAQAFLIGLVNRMNDLESRKGG
jgi:hypothetical protein